MIIKKNRPIVVPVVINGFWRAFTKKGLSFKKRGSLLTVRFKEPLQIDFDAPNEEILEQIMDAIEQSKKYMMKVPHLAAVLKEQQLRRESKAAEQTGD
jgi:1-acyl-sn-glycerol-3-phosphate acyltransferase